MNLKPLSTVLFSSALLPILLCSIMFAAPVFAQSTAPSLIIPPAPRLPRPAQFATPQQLTEEIFLRLFGAEILLQEERAEEALQVILPAAQQLNDARVARRAFEIAMNTRDQRATREALQIWQRTDPNSTDVRRMVAALRMQDKQYVQAAEAYADWQSLAPDDWNAVVGRIQALRLSSQGDAARKVLDDYVAANVLPQPKPNLQNFAVLAAVAKQLEDDYQFAKAASVYANILKLKTDISANADNDVEPDEKPKSLAEIRYEIEMLRRIAASRGAGETAAQRLAQIEAHKPSVRATPEQTALYEASVLNALRDSKTVPHLDRARAMVTEKIANAITQKKPDEEQNWQYELAMLEEAAGNVPKYQAMLRRILEKSPKAAFVQNALGYGLCDLNEGSKPAGVAAIAEGKALLEQALVGNADNPAMLDSLAWCLFRQGEFNKALPILQKAYALHREPETGSHLAELLLALNRKPEAMALFKALYALDAKHEVLLRTLKRLEIAPASLK